MTPVKKSNLTNLSQSVTMNLTSLTKHKLTEEARVKKNFRELRQLLDVREKWLLDQLDQLTNSQIAVLRAQKSTIDEEVSLCKDDPYDNTYCLPLYKFSDVEMPSFLSNYDKVRNCLLQFGEISTKDGSSCISSESKSALDAIESEKWLQQKIEQQNNSDIEAVDQWDLESNLSSTVTKERRSSKSFVKDGLDEWLLSAVKSKSQEDSMSELVRSWTLRDSQNEDLESLKDESVKSQTFEKEGYKQWIKREAHCRLNCPENNKYSFTNSTAVAPASLQQHKKTATEAPLATDSLLLSTWNSNYIHKSTPSSVGFVSAAAVAPVIEIEDLNQLKCVTSEEKLSAPSTQSVVLTNSEMKQWLAVSTAKRGGVQPPRLMVHSPSGVFSDTMTSRCSSVSNFCEANEMCSGFDECLADEPRCLNRYNEWLLTSSKRPCPPKAKLEFEDMSLWLADDKTKITTPTPMVEDTNTNNDFCPMSGCMTNDIDWKEAFLFKSSSKSSAPVHECKMEWFAGHVADRDDIDYWLAKH